MSGMGSIIILMGVALILVNGAKNGQLATAWSIIYDNSVMSVTAAQQSAMLLLGGEILLVIVLAALANTNKSFGVFGLVTLGALWVVWMVKNPSALSSITTPLSGGNNPLSSSTSAFNVTAQNFSTPFSALSSSNGFTTPAETSFNLSSLNTSLLRSATNTKGK